MKWLALCACSLNIVSAQTAAPAKPVAPAAAEAEIKIVPETPTEAAALKIINLVSEFPDIVASIKDEASLTAAQAKLDKLGANLVKEEASLKKLPVPDAAARKKLSDKMKPLQAQMEKKMQKVMMSMQSLPPELAPKIQPMMMGFMQQMQVVGPTMEKYFEPEPEATPSKEAK